MAGVMMALGEFRFSIDTAAYQEFSRTAEYEWAEIPRFGRRPAMQFTGLGRDSITLSGEIYPAYRGGLGQLEAMRTMAEAGEPLLLVAGTGRVWGQWCITAVTEKHSAPHVNGAPRKQGFDLTLIRYGEDAAPVEAPAEDVPDEPVAPEDATPELTEAVAESPVSDQPLGPGVG